MNAKFEITKTVEVTLPHYRKNNFFYYKLLSEDGYTIQVGILPEGANMFAKVEFEKFGADIVFGENTEECTSEEFNAAYKSAIDLIDDKNF